MNTKALRQKILDLAIHGKLVPQDPNDEPASVLLERIKAEKERLIKEGKIKRTKRSKAACDKPHYPYELPEGWEWCKLEDYVSSVTDGDHQAPPKVSNGVPFLVISNVASEFIDFANTRYVPQDYYDAIQFDRKPERGDILFTVTGSYGIVVKVNTDKQFCFQRHIGLIKPIIDNDYLVYALRSQYVKKLCDDLSTGTAQKTVGLDTLRSFLIPIPPLQEQKRIVESIEHCLLFVDCIEENKGNLQDTIKQTKSKILDLAIHGKLVPQDPKNEPATELLKRINPNAKITCDNPHYRNLPEGWAVTTIKDMCENINGLWKGKKKPFVNVGVIRNANFTKDFKLDYSKIEYIDVEQRAFNQRHLKNGDLIVEKSGGSDNNPVGRAILYEGKDSVFSFSNFTMALRIKEKEILTSRYLYYFLLAEYRKGSMRLMQTQTTGLHNLILDKYMSMPVLLPPFSEQLRITEKIEDLFGIMDAIKANL